MKEVRELVSLGLQVRASHKLKVRQPLREAQIVLSSPERRAWLERLLELLRPRAKRLTDFAEAQAPYFALILLPRTAERDH